MTKSRRSHSLVIRPWSWVVCSAASVALAQDPFDRPFVSPPNAAELQNPGGRPGTLLPNASPTNANSLAADQTPISGELFEPGEILATVGDQYILAGDVLPQVNQALEPHRGLAPQDQFDQYRRVLIAQLTAAHVEVKLLYLEFLRKAPEEGVKKVHKNVEEDFAKKLEDWRRKAEKLNKTQLEEQLKEKDPQLHRLVTHMKEAGVWSPGELDVLLRKFGGSLAQEKRYYAESNIGRAMVYQNVNMQPSITHDEMLEYYRTHEKNYLVPERASFEIMSVRFANFATRQEASEAICAMGNEVFYGASFEAVATKKSQGLNAEKGGQTDYTARGSLASKVVDEAIFTLEAGKLSQILEDERGFHIVRVKDRQPEGKVPFEEVQEAIRGEIKKEKMSKEYKAFVVKIKNQTTVWTTFDDDPQLSQFVGSQGRKKR